MSQAKLVFCILTLHVTPLRTILRPLQPILVSTALPCPSFLHFFLTIPVGPYYTLSPLPPNWLLLPSMHPVFIMKPHLQYLVGHNTATIKTDAPISSKISIATYKTTVSQHTRPYFTFRGPCIVIYFYNKSQQDAPLLNFILVNNSTCFGQTYCPSSGVLILYSQQMVSVILVMLTFIIETQDHNLNSLTSKTQELILLKITQCFVPFPSCKF
jgi:hypothetical protein